MFPALNKLAALRAARFASISKGSKSFKVIKGSFSLSGNSRNSPFLSSKTTFISTYFPKSLGESLLLTYSLQSYAHGLGQDGPGILENPQTNPGLHPEQCLFQQFCPEIKPWGRPCSPPLLLAIFGPGLGHDGPGCPEELETNQSIIAEQPLLQLLCPEIKPWGSPCSRPTPGCLWPWTWPRWS